VMIHVTLSHIEAVSKQVPFDMRPLGYGFQEARLLLDALGAEGRIYYLTRQIPLDTLYPALLAMTLVASMLHFARRLPDSRLLRIGIACSLGAALFDYAENLGIAAMILHWPDLTPGIVNATSAASMLKSGATTAAVTITLLVGAASLRRHRAGRAL